MLSNAAAMLPHLSRNAPAMLPHLSDDLATHCLSFLAAHDLAQCTAVSWALRRLAADDALSASGSDGPCTRSSAAASVAADVASCRTHHVLAVPPAALVIALRSSMLVSIDVMSPVSRMVLILANIYYVTKLRERGVSSRVPARWPNS